MQGDAGKALVVGEGELGLKPLEEVGLLVSEAADSVAMESFDGDRSLGGDVLVVFREGKRKGGLVGALGEVGGNESGAGAVGRGVESAEEFDGGVKVFGGTLNLEDACLCGGRGGVIVVFFFLGA